VNVETVYPTTAEEPLGNSEFKEGRDGEDDLIFSRSVPKSCLKLLPSKIGTAKRKM
jgi:hypothetical protein